METEDEESLDESDEDDMNVEKFLPEESLNPSPSGVWAITYKQEDQVINYIRKNPTHGPKTLVTKFRFLSGVAISTIYRAKAQNLSADEKRRKLMLLCEALSVRFDAVRYSEMDHVNDEDLQSWALEASNELNLLNFNACDSFILYWKKKERSDQGG